MSRPATKPSANWPAAKVEAKEDGYVLCVPIQGQPDADWGEAFRWAVEARRNEVRAGHWGHVRHGRDEVRVEQVAEGSEKPLRHFLDTCLNEANERIRHDKAGQRQDEDALERSRIEASHEYGPTVGQHAEAAERMTETFRSR